MNEIEVPPNDAWKTAYRGAFLVGAICAVGCFVFGKPVEVAATNGMMVTFGGLVAWTTYRLISGRSDCLMLVALNTLPIWRRWDDHWLPSLVITGLAMLGVGLVMGFVNRPQSEREPEHDFTWWDAEVDGPR